MVRDKVSRECGSFAAKVPPSEDLLQVRDHGVLQPAVAGLLEVTPLAVVGPQAYIIAKLGNFAIFCKCLAGSFSAVSKRNFAIKYAFDSIFQALQDLHPSAPLRSQYVRKKSV